MLLSVQCATHDTYRPLAKDAEAIQRARPFAHLRTAANQWQPGTFVKLLWPLVLEIQTFNVPCNRRPVMHNPAKFHRDRPIHC